MAAADVEVLKVMILKIVFRFFLLLAEKKCPKLWFRREIRLLVRDGPSESDNVHFRGVFLVDFQRLRFVTTKGRRWKKISLACRDGLLWLSAVPSSPPSRLKLMQIQWPAALLPWKYGACQNSVLKEKEILFVSRTFWVNKYALSLFAPHSWSYVWRKSQPRRLGFVFVAVAGFARRGKWMILFYDISLTLQTAMQTFEPSATKMQ